MSKDEVKQQFIEDVANHKLTIKQDDGVFRHLYFGKPGTVNHSFALTTWPNHLCISGDMGTYVFSRLHDMFEFFRGDELKINYGYWTQKLQSISKYGSREGGVNEYDAEATYNAVYSCLLDEDTSSEEVEEKLEGLKDCTSGQEALDTVLSNLDLDCCWEYIHTKPTFHMEARFDDYIIQGIKGEIYPCKPDIFEATYEPVEEAP